MILHIVIVLDVYQLSAMLPGQAGSFKNQKTAFLNDPKSQKRGFGPFSGLWSERKGQNSPFFEGFSSLVGLDF